MKHLTYIFLLLSNVLIAQEIDSIWHSELPELPIVSNVTSTATVLMTKNEFKRMPASFGDPTRVLHKYPGFSGANDGANGIVYHGLPPESIQWQLEGVRIVNPNHLSNAGTSDDIMTYNAGGTIAMPAAALGTFSFDGQPASIQNSTAWGGSAEMNFAKKISSFYELSLVGFEAGLGSTKNNKSSYIIARNSFVGVLGALGVDFGGEKINYTDLSGYKELINKSDEQLSIFFNGGFSNNFKAALKLGDTITRYKDYFDIDYEAYHAMAGLKYKKYWDNIRLLTSWVSSTRSDKRTELPGKDFAGSRAYQIDKRQDNYPIAGHTVLQTSKFNADWTFGLRTNWQIFKYYRDIRTIYEKTYQRIEANPYIEYQRLIHKQNIILSTGISSLRWRPDLSLKLHSNLRAKYSYLLSVSNTHPTTFGPLSANSKSVLTNVSLKLQYKHRFLFLVSPFYMNGRNLRQFDISGFIPTTVEMVNGDFNILLQLDNSNTLQSTNGYFKNLGIDFRLSKELKRGNSSWTFDANTSFFDMKTQAYKWDPSMNSRYNYNFVGNLGIYYQLNILTNKNLAIGTTSHYRGGERPSEFERFSNYFRQDLRVAYYYPSRKGNIHRWALDIQNVTARVNDGFYDYNFFERVIIPQLGLIPNLSYRLEY